MLEMSESLISNDTSELSNQVPLTNKTEHIDQQSRIEEPKISQPSCRYLTCSVLFCFSV